MKLGIITYKDIISIDYYRTLGFYPFLKGVEAEHLREVDWHTIGKYDAIIVSRPVNMYHYRYCQIVRECGRKLIVEYDDDLLNLPAVPQFKGFLENRETLIKCIEMADMVIVSTSWLKKIYQEYNKNVMVRLNMHNDKLFKFEPEFSKNETIGFRGARLVHEWNIKGFLPVFNVKGDWIFWGGDLWMYSGKHLPEMTFIDFMVNFRRNSPGVVFKPLVDIPHNRAKSNCTWIETTYAGGVCLAPDWEEWRMPGITNYSGVEDCIEKLLRLQKDRNLRERLFRESRDYIKKNLLLSNAKFNPEDYGL